MINLKKTIVDLQRLENAAAEKVGMRLLMIEEARLYGKDRAKYAAAIAALILKDCEDEIREAAMLAIPIHDEIAGTHQAIADYPGDEYLQYFKMTASLLIGQMADRLAIKIARNKSIGVDEDVIAGWRADPKSILNIERYNLTKALKREMAGVLNRVFQAIIMKANRA